ncbi:hypothetical protein K0M31_000590 [Melipona bicolor]|uniref:Uncharacterized protein n=1 Tax=Melipona bicolor TaxID=60889 RepID=A0AA40GDU9_9HYME|nr:hypothetical protein K0M31_000590 [Melipona bicolor]
MAPVFIPRAVPDDDDDDDDYDVCRSRLRTPDPFSIEPERQGGGRNTRYYVNRAPIPPDNLHPTESYNPWIRPANSAGKPTLGKTLFQALWASVKLLRDSRATVVAATVPETKSEQLPRNGLAVRPRPRLLAGTIGIFEFVTSALHATLPTRTVSLVCSFARVLWRSANLEKEAPQLPLKSSATSSRRPIPRRVFCLTRVSRK